jgi:hypothetical protein
MIGRRRSSRSATAPANRPNIRWGSVDAAASRPISKDDVPVSRVAAVSGIASRETSDPLSEMVRADQ